MSTKHYTFAIAGTSHYTQLLADSLIASGSFTPNLVITPAPKPIGRKKELLPNPVHTWAKTNQLPLALIEKKITPELISQALGSDFSNPALIPDFLIVVYFGYLVPDWLLNWPRFYPINVHPSALPDWRGASPGQFTLLADSSSSAISIIIPNSKMDQGDLIHQIPFTINPTWNKDQYYDFAFNLTAQHFPQILLDLTAKKLIPSPQPPLSPTPIARQLTKDDGFIPYNYLLAALEGQPSSELPPDSPFLLQLLPKLKTLNPDLSLDPASVIERASRALSPWPGIWTLQPQTDPHLPAKRLKILQLHLEKPTTQPQSPAQKKLILDQALLEGRNYPHSFELLPTQ